MCVCLFIYDDDDGCHRDIDKRPNVECIRNNTSFMHGSLCLRLVYANTSMLSHYYSLMLLLLLHGIQILYTFISIIILICAE